MATVALMLFTRDLRVLDQPALAAAVRRADRVVPLFVLDEAILGSDFAAPNRLAFLAESLRDLDREFADRGARLVVRRGDAVEEALDVAREVGAGSIHLSVDASSYAVEREARLRRAAGREIEVVAYPGVTIVEPGALRPAGGDHYKVFTPYWRAWTASGWRAPVRAPGRIRLPEGLSPGSLPTVRELAGPGLSPERPPGGIVEGERRLRRFLAARAAGCGDANDALAAPRTSELSPYFHFGCVSALRAAEAARRRDADDFVRQLCWRDFHHQVLRARPSLPRRDYRDRGRRWNHDEDAVDAWRQGTTGVPIVDAGMRQLARTGWMHNRARLIVAAHLTKELGIHWSAGARHFLNLLADGDLANNSGNWQWVAGTGNDTRPNRRFNLVRQARRFDPDGDYVRRNVPELAGIDGPAVHEPWALESSRRRRLAYPRPLAVHQRQGRASTIPGARPRPEVR